jgi:hypothetical protein
MPGDGSLTYLKMNQRPFLIEKEYQKIWERTQ